MPTIRSPGSRRLGDRVLRLIVRTNHSLEFQKRADHRNPLTRTHTTPIEPYSPYSGRDAAVYVCLQIVTDVPAVCRISPCGPTGIEEDLWVWF